ncbi:DUF3387 domain-containing protein [Echinicola salinicaeni]|nr:DUF3387 domain-containing protein [Echinicola salinicaeni]
MHISKSFMLIGRYGYPPDFSQEAIDLVLKQTTALADIWTED